ncbi:MAG: carboxypeptidase-like regulatory domain-containing protein [Flavobacteriales bacterium]|nr:carboxypeptidase-like regulatory domain-containing protein [Flavobacteriales bacterium]
MKKGVLICVLMFLTYVVQAQLTQTITGKVVDATTNAGLVGATILVETATGIGAMTGEGGYFKLVNVPIGRHRLTIEYVGYETVVKDNVMVTSGKEVDLMVEMQESSMVTETATVTVKRSKVSSNNQMVAVSSRSFDAEEAERYPGSRQDPARMAQNYAGVAGTDDQRNDIVIRGNSPLGLLWRLEGVDIFNPSHFAVAGTTGGPISMLNNKLVGNSDFMTSAFPAEYGNGISGVFDLKMRNGNYNKSEYSVQFGLFGTELQAEGPLNKEKKSSYTFSYRYATFSIFRALNIDLGTDAIPQYQDVNFKLNYPKKNGNFSVFGVGGLSAIDIVFSDDEAPTKEIYGEKDRDQYFRTNMGVVGAVWERRLSTDKTFNLVFAQNVQQVLSSHDKIYRDPDTFTRVSLLPVLRSDMMHGKSTFHASITKKYSSKSVLKYGFIADLYQINYLDSVRNERTYQWSEHLNYKGNAFMTRMYANWKYRLNARTTITSGLHAMQFTQGGNAVVEPRVGIKWRRLVNESFSLGYGMHSQTQPLYVYFTQFVDSISKTFGKHNEQIGLTQSHHLVGSYERTISKSIRFRTEIYHQWLFNVPVEMLSSSFSLLNQGSGFTRFFPDVLQNSGTGTNKGIELTVEKFFSKNYYFMTTASVYDSKYKGSDGVTRNTDFNGNFILNGLAGYEYRFAKNDKNALIFGTKYTIGGGKRYSPIDTAATMADGANVIIVDNQRNIYQFKNYSRLDVKLGVRINTKKTTHEFSLDIANVMNTKNILKENYFDDPENPGIKKFGLEYQLGRLPNFWYKVNF